jgi:transcriptional regulator with XRE-family HTH domain
MLTPAQLRAARASLGWSRDQLAAKSDTAAMTVRAFESRGSDPKRSTLLAWSRAIEAAGVRLIDDDEQGGAGVRLKTASKRQ